MNKYTLAPIFVLFAVLASAHSVFGFSATIEVPVNVSPSLGESLRGEHNSGFSFNFGLPVRHTNEKFNIGYTFLSFDAVSPSGLTEKKEFELNMLEIGGEIPFADKKAAFLLSLLLGEVFSDMSDSVLGLKVGFALGNKEYQGSLSVRYLDVDSFLLDRIVIVSLGGRFIF